LKRIVVGLFYQSFRLEFGSDNSSTVNTYIFPTRNHSRTHEFIDELTNNVQRQQPGSKISTVEDNDEWEPEKRKKLVYNNNKVILEGMKNTLRKTKSKKPVITKNTDLRAYTMVYRITKPNAPNLKNDIINFLENRVNPKSVGLVTRSLILTEKRIFLCEEDYGRWPPLDTTKQNAAQPGITVQHVQKISDVEKVIVEGISTRFRIFFDKEQEEDEEDDASNKEWFMVAETRNERDYFLSTLGSLFKQQMKFDMKMITSTNLDSPTG